MADTTRYVRHTDHQFFSAKVTAHEQGGQRLLAVHTHGKDRPHETGDTPPLALALVLDRSGSMASGDKLAATRAAAARVVRGMRPVDRVAVVAYDDQVRVLSELAPPSAELAERVARLEPGGSTALYEGWLAGAKLIPSGGRIVLLSDGLANVGRYTDAASLARHAGVTLRKFGKTTTTIGVGADYDEALMAGMAASGGGSHYFARTADRIAEAFAQEKIQAAETVLWDVVLRAGRRDVTVGYIVAGETRGVIVDDAGPGTRLVLSFRDSGGERHEVVLEVPTEFGHDLEAGALWLAERAARLDDEIGTVHSAKQAEELAKPVRDLLLEVNNHPLVDGPTLAPVRARLDQAHQRLLHLARHYDEGQAMLDRKIAWSSSARSRNRANWIGEHPDEDDVARRAANAAYGVAENTVLAVDPRAFAIRPPEFWIDRKAAPVEVTDTKIVVVIPSKKEAFVLDDLARELGVRVRLGRRFESPDVIRAAILAAAGRAS